MTSSLFDRKNCFEVWLWIFFRNLKIERRTKLCSVRSKVRKLRKRRHSTAFCTRPFSCVRPREGKDSPRVKKSTVSMIESMSTFKTFNGLFFRMDLIKTLCIVSTASLLLCLLEKPSLRETWNGLIFEWSQSRPLISLVSFTFWRSCFSITIRPFGVWNQTIFEMKPVKVSSGNKSVSIETFNDLIILAGKPDPLRTSTGT